MKNYDLIIIGSGSGLEVSSEAAERGLSVAVVENGPFGGTCLNRGCIPSKMLIHCADVMETIKQSARFGIKATVEAVDWQFIVQRASDEVDEEARTVEEGNRQAPNIDVYQDTARFVGVKMLEVAGEQIQAETILIAAGTRPWAPETPGLRDVALHHLRRGPAPTGAAPAADHHRGWLYRGGNGPLLRLTGHGGDHCPAGTHPAPR